MGGWEEKWRLKLTSAKAEVEVEAELGKKKLVFLIHKKLVETVTLGISGQAI